MVAVRDDANAAGRKRGCLAHEPAHGGRVCAGGEIDPNRRRGFRHRSRRLVQAQPDEGPEQQDRECDDGSDAERGSAMRMRLVSTAFEEAGRGETVEVVDRRGQLSHRLSTVPAGRDVLSNLIGRGRGERPAEVVEQREFRWMLRYEVACAHPYGMVPLVGARRNSDQQEPATSTVSMEIARLVVSRLSMGASVDDSLAALEAAPALFASATDFTIGIEEEFQVLDARTFELTDRFEDLKRLTETAPWAEHVAGELIASEIEVKTGRCETFEEAATLMRQRRLDLGTLAESAGLTLAALGTHPTSRWSDQRIIDTAHYRLVQDRLRYVAWRNNTFGLHVHVGIRDADRAISVMNQARAILPEVLAMSATSPWLDGAATFLHSTRTQIFTRMFPRCGVPDAFSSWAEYDAFVRMLLETKSILEHTEIWWSVRPHQSFGTIEVRIAEALPDIAEAIAVAAFQVAALATFAERYDEGRAPEPLAGRFIEENLWRAIRHGLSGGFVDLDRLVEVDAADHIRRQLESFGPAIDRLGLAPHLAPLEDLLAHGDHAGRYLARIEAGEDPKAIFIGEASRTLASASPVNH